MENNKQVIIETSEHHLAEINTNGNRYSSPVTCYSALGSRHRPGNLQSTKYVVTNGLGIREHIFFLSFIYEGKQGV